MHRYAFITMAVVGLVFAPRPATAQANPTAALEAAAEQAARRINAAAYLDVAGCGLEVSIVRGVADRATGVAAPIDAPLRIASVGKLYTAAVIHRLAARGALDIDVPVSQLLQPGDAVGVAGREATLRQLLNHTGGVFDYYDLPDIRRWDWRQPLTPQRVLAAIAGRPATALPGTRYSYSNSGYQLVALAAERATGRAFSALLDEELLQPLALTATRYNQVAPGGPLHGYVARNDMWGSAENTGPDGGMTATLADLRRYLRALFIEPGAYRAAGDAMTRNPVETGRPRQLAGAGAEVRISRQGLALVGHTGDVEGYLSFAYAAPAQGVTMIGHITSSDRTALTELIRATGEVVEAACRASSAPAGALPRL